MSCCGNGENNMFGLAIAILLVCFLFGGACGGNTCGCGTTGCGGCCS